MRTYEVSLIEWPEGPDRGGPRLLARSVDHSLVEFVREHLIAEQKREIARLRGPDLRSVEDREAGGAQ